MTSYWTGKKRENMMGTKNPMYKPKIEKICKVCGTIFNVYPCRFKAQFCSYNCKYKAQTGSKNIKQSETKIKLFQNGHLKVWNKGLRGVQKQSIKRKKQVSEQMKGNKFRLGKSPYNKGTKGISKPNKTSFVKGDLKLIERRITQIFPLQDTSIEVMMQNELKERGIKFEKHKLVIPELHFRCDLFLEPNIVVECDGDYWHHYPEGTEKDRLRTNLMQEKGLKVLRYWEHEIKSNTEGCVDEIEEILCMSYNNQYIGEQNGNW